MQSYELAEYQAGIINETVASVLVGKHQHKTIPFYSTLETYEETPIFIPVDITEDAVEMVTRKCSGSSGPGGRDSEAFLGCLLNSGGDRKRLRTSVETVIDCLYDKSPPWSAYRAFMYGYLISFDKEPVANKVRVRETWRHLFYKILLKVTKPESTMACQDEQLCS